MEVLKDILGSKKHWVAIITILVVALNKKIGLGLDSEEVKWIVTLASSLILAQGAMDIGKGKAKLEAKNGTTGS